VPWKLTVRAGPRVDRSTFDQLDEALKALESRGRELARAAPRRVVDAKVRRFDPGQLVSARLQLAGPERVLAKVQAGVDVHGDGSVEAYLGRIRRRVVQQGRGESAYQALRRTLRD
jgi:hypothetical protein